MLALFALLVLSQTEPVDARAEAKRLFLEAEALHEKHDLSAATERFNASFTLRHSAATAFNLAQCEAEQQHPERALVWLRWYLRLSPTATDRREVEAQVRRHEAALAARGVQVVLAFVEPATATVFIDDVARGVEAGTATVPFGKHSVAARAPGFADVRLEVDVTRAKAEVLELSLTALPVQPMEQPKPVDVPVAEVPAPPPPVVVAQPQPQPPLPLPKPGQVLVANQAIPGGPQQPTKKAPSNTSVWGVVGGIALGVAALGTVALASHFGTQAKDFSNNLRDGVQREQDDNNRLVDQIQSSSTGSNLLWVSALGLAIASAVTIGASL